MVRQISLTLMLLFLTVLLPLTGWAGKTATRPTQLIISHSASYPPFSFINEQGKPTGYLIDIWTAFGEANNLGISFKLGTWKDSLDFVKEGKADVHAGLFYNEERDGFLDYGPTIMNVATDIYAHVSLPKDKQDSVVVGVIRDGYSEYFMRKEYPQRKLQRFASSKETIRAVKEGIIQEFISDRPTAIYHLRHSGIVEQFTSIKPLYSNELRIAVGEGNRPMLEIVQNGWHNIDEAKLKAIHDKWFVTTKETSDWLVTSLMLAGLALFLGIVIRAIGLRIHNQ